jgi:hypothetical protein
LIKLFGFSILRNGVKYDYSFKESLLSLSGLVESTYLALDPGEDSTKEELSALPSLKIIPSTWDMSLKKGLVLSVETNKALDGVRANHGEDDEAWGIYLQADEVLHEEDYQLLKRDILRAQSEGYDAISFRYLHFWQTHHHLVISKKWYPQEIRAIKIKSKIESWGDAQGFRNFSKIFNSEARIFHYGHVREQNSYNEKMRDMGKFYHSAEMLEEKLSSGLKDSKKNRCVFYFGTHPLVMKDRIIRMGDIWQLEERDEIYIVGNRENYSPQVIESIAAKKVNWCKNTGEVPRPKRSEMVLTNPSLLDYFFRLTSVPKKMKSKSARPWSSDFRFILQVSEKRIGFRSKA